MKKLAVISLVFTLVALSGVLSAAGQTSSPTWPEPKPSRPLYQPADLQSLERRQAEAASPLGAGASAAPAVGEGWSKTVSQYATQTNWEIVLTDGTTASPVNLTNYVEHDIQPRMTRGCTQVVYASMISGEYQIKTRTQGTTSPQTLTSGSSDNLAPAWSPDGAKIAFESYRDGPKPEVYVMNADGSAQTRLTFDPEYDGMPTWSPDGTKIAFISYRSGGYRVWVMNTDGSGQTQLNDQPYSARPRYSPDGAYIAFDANADAPDEFQELWVMRSDGSGAHLAFNSPYPTADTLVSGWSPTGSVNVTHVYWIFYENEWWWVEAYMALVPNTGELTTQYSHLTISGVDWFHDWQPYDLTPPVTTIYGMPEISPAPLIVHITASDEGGSGILYGYGEYKDGIDGAWMPFPYWSHGVYINNPLGGHTYYFRVRYMDNAGNVEPWPAEYDAMTTMEAQPPESRVLPLEPFTRGDSVDVSWTGTEYGGSWIMDFGMQFKDLAGGDWSDWDHDVFVYTDTFVGDAGHSYAFRSRAMDAASNLEAEHSDTGDTRTTFYDWMISGQVTDISGAPVMGALAQISSGQAGAQPSDRHGNYTSYAAGENDYPVSWGKSGYLTLPATSFDSTPDASKNVYLPPADNHVQNWGFEDPLEYPLSDWIRSGPVTPTQTTDRFSSGSAAGHLGVSPVDLVTIREPITQTDLLSTYPTIAIDSNGRGCVAWHEGMYTFNINVSCRDQNGVWSSPLDFGPIGWMPPKIAAGPDDSFHLVWGGQDLFYAWRSPEGVWSSPVSLFDTPEFITDTDMHVGNDGIVHVVFRGYNSGYALVYLQRSADGVWSSPYLFPGIAASGAWPRMAIGDDGTVHLIWSDELNGQWTGYSSRSPDGIWSDPLTLPFHYYYEESFHIISTPDLKLHLIFEAGDSINEVFYVQRQVDGSWTDPILVSQDNQRAFNSRMISDGAGNIHVVWIYEQASDQITYSHARRSSSGQWSAISEIRLHNRSMSAPALGVNPQGDLYLFAETSSDSYRYDIEFAWMRNNAWSDPVFVTQDEPPNHIGGIGVDDTGRAHLVQWNDYFQYSDIFYDVVEPNMTTGVSALSQVLTIPANIEHPALSLSYALQGASSELDNRFQLELTDGVMSSYLISSTTDTQGWEHAWFDLSDWRDRTITITLSAEKSHPTPDLQVWLDEITLGSIYADLWLDTDASQFTLHPGDLITLTIQAGNRGSVLASSAQISMTVPAGLEVVSTSQVPSATSPALVFDLGDLGPQTSPTIINISFHVIETVPGGTTLTVPASIQSPSEEMDLDSNHLDFELLIDTTERLYLPALY